MLYLLLTGLLTLTSMALPAYADPAVAALEAQVLNPDWHLLRRPRCGKLLVAGSDGVVWTAPAGRHPAWQPARTRHDGRVIDIVEAPDALLAIGTRGLLLRSDDCGQHWTSLQDGGEADLFVAVAADDDLLVAGEGRRLLRGDRSASRWLPLESPVDVPRALAAVRTGSLALRWWLLGADGDLWRSDDRGERWTRADAPTPDLQTLAADGDVLIAGSGRGEIHTLGSDGRGWRRAINLPGASVDHLWRGPAGSWWAWGAGGGCAWAQRAQGPWRGCRLPGRRLVRSIATDPSGKAWVAALEGAQLMRSTDRGHRWQATGLGVTPRSGRAIEAVAWDPERGGFWAAGSGAWLLAGSADGAQWTPSHAAPSYVHDLRRVPGGDLLAVMNDRWMARSADAGSSWALHHFKQLDEPAYLTHIGHDEQRSAVLVSGSQGALIHSPDGRHWRSHRTGHKRGYLGMLPLPSEDAVLLFGSPRHGLRVRMSDGLLADMPLPSPDVLYGGFHDAGRQQVFLLGANGALLHSGDGGMRWTSTRVGSRTLHAGVATPDGQALLVAGESGALYRAQWRIDGSLGDWRAVGDQTGDWRHLMIDQDTGSVWLLGLNGGLRQSMDSGQSWQTIALPTTAHLRRPAFDLVRRVWWMPGRDGTLLRGSPDGREWHSVFTHTREHLKGVLVHPATGELLLYGARLVRLTER
ncbi:WD40/YVTN/BNR-like repeat-containing protein, partial [Aquabacterium sp.]|uniref:WD40/YVTN/BNR-like repeat-containing protein n=1 Tax=Aquabacterium sp. TaxID=1872578 RepID=UPI002C86D2AD